MFNNIVLNALSSYPMYQWQARAGCSFSIDALPHIGIITRDLAVSVIIQEIIFYYSHRLAELVSSVAMQDSNFMMSNW